jgi:hypothetical protein
MARSVKTKDAPAMLPGGLLALSERLRHHAKAIMVTKNLPLISNILRSPFAGLRAS